MRTGNQKNIAEKIGISNAYISQIINGHRNASARVAKKLSEATGVSPLIWLYGSKKEKKEAVERYKSSTN